jgi:hypothetical protein
MPGRDAVLIDLLPAYCHTRHTRPITRREDPPLFLWEPGGYVRNTRINPPDDAPRPGTPAPYCYVRRLGHFRHGVVSFVDQRLRIYPSVGGPGFLIVSGSVAMIRWTMSQKVSATGTNWSVAILSHVSSSPFQ